MAIGKWIPFSSSGPAAAAQNVKPEAVRAISSADTKKFGFENFGNTCYANSVLQALYFCSPFRDLLLQYADHSTLLPTIPQPYSSHTPAANQSNAQRKPQRKHSSAGQPSDAVNVNGSAVPPTPVIPSHPSTMLSALRSLFLFISKNPADKGTVAPRAFIEKLKDVNELFRSTMHQDAHEFLNYLLNKIVEEIEDERKADADDLSNSVGTLSSRSPPTATSSSNAGTSPSDATLVHKLFEGVLTSETRCLTCETVSSRDEAFLDLSIDIEQNSSVTACLRQFSASEMLCQKNKFFCDACCDLQEAEKRMKIKKLPNILALHLKRFKYQEDVQKYIKLTYRVAFPFELRLFNTVDDTEDADRLYELFAIVVHIGNGPHHGHYVSIIKTNGSWTVFDDDAVDSIKESDIPKYFGESNAGSAYVLYYQAVDIDLGSLGLRIPVSESTEQSATQPTDSPHSLPQSAPALPPGLAEEDKSSDISELPSVSTPALDAPHRPPELIVAEESSSVSPSAPPSPSMPISAPVESSPKVGLFKSLRQSPSKIRLGAAGFGTTSDSRMSVADRTHQPVTTPDLADARDQSTQPSTSPLPEEREGKENKGGQKEKEKDGDRKSNNWFRSKSLKRSKTTAAQPSPPLVPPLPKPEGRQSRPQEALSLSPAWYRASLSNPLPLNGNDRRKPSEPNTRDAGHSKKLRPSLDDRPSPAWLHINGYGAHSVDSLSTSYGSSSSRPSADTSQGRSPRHQTSQSVSMTPPLPNLPVGTKKSNVISSRPPPVQTKSSARPSTASGTLERSPVDTVPPEYIHPLPSSSSLRTNGKSTVGFEQRFSSRYDHQDSEPTTKAKKSANDRVLLSEPSPAFASVVDTGSTASASSNLRRATRKLSLSAPMLGFGKRDKEKERQKEKEKDRDRHTDKTIPPRSFMASAMSPRI